MNQRIFGAVLCFLLIAGCNKPVDEQIEPGTTPAPQPAPEVAELKNRSNAEALSEMAPGFSGVSIYTLISSSDTIAASPNFVYAGTPDGSGLLKNPDGSGFVMVNNHENLWSVSRLYLDKKLNVVKGEYLLNGDGGMFRLCSGSLATPEEHGFPNPVFLSTGESNANAMTHAIDPLGTADPSNQARVKPALGKFSGENSVPLRKDAYSGKTVVILGEDNANGQVYLYVSNTAGDLDNGLLYSMRRKDKNAVETDMAKGQAYDVEFVEIPNAKSLTGAEIESVNKSNQAIQFGRVEDLDYRKGGGAASREIYFSATGVPNQPEKTQWGRVYQLKLDAGNPLSGKLSIIADGADNPGNDLVNPDNICATQNFVYIQEDGSSYYPGVKHDSYIWQYDIATGTKKPFMTMRSQALSGTKYNPEKDARFGVWEYGAMIDVSDLVGVPGTFTLNVQPHTWEEGNRFKNPSKASSAQSYKAGGQTLILANVPK
jgi:hypothetical protein